MERFMFQSCFYLSVQEALHLFPKMTADPLESGVVRVHLGGEGYNRKTLNRVKRSVPKQQVRRCFTLSDTRFIFISSDKNGV